jgi:hypothetical protein
LAFLNAHRQAKSKILATRFSSELISPNLSPGKVKFYDFILNMLPVLKVGAVNRLIARHEGKTGIPLVRDLCEEIGVTVNITGLQNLPKTGPVTIVSNHPGGADILATIVALGRMREDISILANKLICLDQVKHLVIPIDLLAKEKVNPELVHEAYRQGRVVVFYAAGKNSRYDEAGNLKDRRWRTSFMEYARQYQTPVNVLKIEGTNSPLFYKVSRFREKYERLKNVPLENMFQLRELITAKGEVKMFLSKPVSFPPDFESNELSERQKKRKKTDALYDFVYEMDANNLEFK